MQASVALWTARAALSLTLSSTSSSSSISRNHSRLLLRLLNKLFQALAKCIPGAGERGRGVWTDQSTGRCGNRVSDIRDTAYNGNVARLQALANTLYPSASASRPDPSPTQLVAALGGTEGLENMSLVYF